MQFSNFNLDIPKWAKEAMMMTCRYCGCYIIDNGNESPNHTITVRRCANPKCPGHMSHKVVYLAKHYGIEGIGPATALNMVKDYRMESHLDAIPIWFKKDKPTEMLGSIADLACIEGYGETKAMRDLNCYRSFEDYFKRGKGIEPLVWNNRDLLFKAETYFHVAEPLSTTKMYVMMTGSFNGYENRSDFLKEVNDAFGNMIQVIDVKKRKTGVHYLIREKNAVDRSKTTIAKEYHIPIVTPAEFVDILCGLTHS